MLAWIAITTNLKIGVVHKENPAGRAITKLLTSLDLEEEHSRLFVRPVGREEADANTARTPYDLATQTCAAAIAKAKVVIATTGLVWEQKGQIHSPLRVHMESVDILVSEEAQQDMDLKSAFVPAVPRQPFFRLLFGDPKQSPGGVADNFRDRRALLLTAPIGLRAAHQWFMPHELQAVVCGLLQGCSEISLEALVQAARTSSHSSLGARWKTREECPSQTPVGASLQAAHKDLLRVDFV